MFALIQRVTLFALVNIGVVIMLTTVSSLFGIAPYLSQSGLNLTSLAVFASVIGFVGAFISLFMSKKSAKWGMKVQVVDGQESREAAFVYQVVERIAGQQGIGMPEVGIYPSKEINAFATGWNKNNALVAVSQGLLDQMDNDEIEGVLAHEMAHVVNGDMVTLTLIQGIVNTFVVFFARVLAYAAQAALANRGNSDQGYGANHMGGGMYYLISMILEFAFGFLATMIVSWFSRWREYGADRGGAEFSSPAKMIKALEFLQKNKQMIDTRHRGYESLKISYPASMMTLFATHPPLEERIEALKKNFA